jgi:hypothetical protein
LGVGRWALGVERWALGVGHWALGIGHWALGEGIEFLLVQQDSKIPSPNCLQDYPVTSLCTLILFWQQDGTCRGLWFQSLIAPVQFICAKEHKVASSGISTNTFELELKMVRHVHEIIVMYLLLSGAVV